MTMSSQDIHQDFNIPQNPYYSYIVKASAGTGKTYQLSQRFLFLVGAGADPSTILTVTFTKKAASEMKERIISSALKLIVDPKIREEFSLKQNIFYQEAKKTLSRRFDESRLSPPRSAEKTGEIILSSTQLLKISTIDSIFLDWVRKFPWETGGTDEKGNKTSFPTPFMLMDDIDHIEYNEKAWRHIFGSPQRRDTLIPIDGDQQGILAAKSRFFGLSGLESFLWYIGSIIKAPSTLLAHGVRAQKFSNEHELLKDLYQDIQKIAAEAKPEKRDKILSFISEVLDGKGAIKEETDSPLYGLVKLEFFKQGYEVSKNFVRDQKRERVLDSITAVETAVKEFQNRKKLLLLNLAGESILSLFREFQAFKSYLKHNQAKADFNDLAKGCFALFHDPVAVGARYLIHQGIHHLMLDEFQDTSWLQWSIFKNIALELMSGSAGAEERLGLPSTVFVVGDEKQSIYGFRESDPEVLKAACDELTPLDLREYQLSESYRSTSLLMDFINELFGNQSKNGQKIFFAEQFPEHKTAQKDDLIPLIPNVSRIAVAPICSLVQGDPDSPLDREAKIVASYISDVLSCKIFCPVYDKKSESFRLLRPSDCVILYRNATHADKFEYELRKRNVPCERTENKGFFSEAEISDLVSLLKFLAMPNDLLSLMTFLKGVYARVSDEELLELLDASKSANMADFKSFRRVEYILDGMNTKKPEVFKLLNELMSGSCTLRVHQILLKVAYYIRSKKGPPELQIDSENFRRFFEICLGLEQKGHTNLTSLVLRLNKLSEEDNLQSSSSKSETVKLMTIHKAKGLEFPFVALIETGQEWEKIDRYWLKATDTYEDRCVPCLVYVGSKNEQPIGDPSFNRIFEQLTLEKDLESNRLLYVALTRAEQYLLVTGHTCHRNDAVGTGFHKMIWNLVEERGLDQTSYLVNYREEDRCEVKCWEKIPKELRTLSKQTDLMDLSSENVERETITKSDIWKGISQEKFPLNNVSIVSPHEETHATNIEKVGFNVSAIDKQVLRLHGIYVHSGLEAFVKKRNWEPKKEWDRTLKSNLTFSELSSFGQKDQDQVFAFADKELTRVINSKTWKDLIESSISCEAEVDILHLTDDGLVRGVIDLLVQKSSQHFLIVDYKTAEIGNNAAVKGKDYTSQLSYYVEAMKSMHPKAKIEALVYFTKNNTTCFL